MTRADRATPSRHRRLPRRLAGAATGAVLLISAAAPLMAADLCKHPYYPVSAGPKYNYRTSYDVGEELPVDFTLTFTGITADGFTQHLEYADGSLDRVWKCTPAGLVATEYLSITAPQRRTQLEIKSTGGISLPPAEQWKKGYSWEQSFEVRDLVPSEEHGETTGKLTIKYEIGEPESVTVEAGKFDAIKVYLRMKQDLTVKKGGESFPMDNVIGAVAWYVKDVGLVKASSETVATNQLQSITK